jgi:hypothetical protein
MHVSRRRVLGIVVAVLLVSATATTALSLTARAQTYQDTSLSASAVTADTFGGSDLTATAKYLGADGGYVIVLSGSGVTSWSLFGTPPSGVSLSSTSAGDATISYQGSETNDPELIVADATDSSGNAEALEVPVILDPDYIATNGTQYVYSVFDLTDSNSAGTVTFTGRTSENYALTWTESDLPSGLGSGDPATGTMTYTGGTAAPGTYSGAKVTATDTGDGAVLNGTFTITVSASVVTTNPSAYGDEVNKFGYGFDSFRKHDYAGALIVGWPAAQADYGTYFFEKPGRHAGAYQFEYTPGSVASGLCVSDPGGGSRSDPLRDGLILAKCNSGPFQQFIPQPDGTLKNLGTGLYVDPHGKGAQLRGESSPAASGGSRYTWTAESSLPD